MGNGTDFPSKKRPEASFTNEKKTNYSDSLSAQFQGNPMHMYFTKNSVASASGDTSLLKRTIVSDARQNQAYDILHHLMRKHHEKLSFLTRPV